VFASSISVFFERNVMSPSVGAGRSSPVKLDQRYWGNARSSGWWCCPIDPCLRWLCLLIGSATNGLIRSRQHQKSPELIC